MRARPNRLSSASSPRWWTRCIPVLAGCVALSAFLTLASPASAQLVEYYHADLVGNVRAITDDKGAVIERHDYLPFGEECTTGPCATNPGVGEGEPRKFTAKERDPETGLDYFGARYYGSRIGRFTTVDPVYTWQENLLDPQRWNRYAYGRNNPLRYVDPDGRIPIDIIWDVANVIYDVYIGVTTGNWTDLGADALATAIPYVPAGASKLRHLGKLDDAIDAAKRANGIVDASKGVDFTADLGKTAAKSRSGHSYAGNKQLHEAMASNPARRAEIEGRYGSDAFERTSTGGGGRRNPRGAEWDHSSTDASALDLRSRESHLQKTKREGQAGGGWKKFHRDKTE